VRQRLQRSLHAAPSQTAVSLPAHKIPVSLVRKIRKAVIPAAGLGTRFLPATKALPKEMLPVAGRPLIQYAVEEAVASGLETIILVTSDSKRLLAEHFRRDTRLENVLRERGKIEQAELIRRVAELAEICTICQAQPLGLADAVRTAQPLVGNEPFALILPDVLIDFEKPCMRQLIECYERHPGCILSTRMVDACDAASFGMLDAIPLSSQSGNERVLKVISLMERPQHAIVNPGYGIFGRYVLEPGIFDAIECTKPGFAGEFQLTDALQVYCASAPVYAYRFEGHHFDAGSPAGFLQANLAYALKDPDLACAMSEYLAELGSSSCQTVVRHLA
jgi:UTP--glucose-1-phosphate uridylyltransferase